jgi:hypothetical protein
MALKKIALLLPLLAMAGCGGNGGGGGGGSSGQPTAQPPGVVLDGGGGSAQATSASWSSVGQPVAGSASSGTTVCEAGFVTVIYGQ